MNQYQFGCLKPVTNIVHCLQIVHLIGQEKEEQIKEELRQLSNTLRKNDNSKILNSTVLCISWVESVRYYGVSMSTHRKPGRQIIIAASCLNFWDDYVADAVKTYCPQKKKYFDGTIQLPSVVQCEAFHIRERKSMPPCLSCCELFGLQATETQNNDNKSPYGNCAEAESLSKLLKSEERVKERVQRSGNWTEQGRKKAEHDVLRHLKQVLNNNKHFKWNNKEINFYIPRYARPDSDEDEDFPM